VREERVIEDERRVLICLREQRERETGWAIATDCREYCNFRGVSSC
jgi:L-amino acid N-acyltransferase YncA